MDETKFSKYKVQVSLREQIEPDEIFFDGSKIKEFEAGELEVGKFETPISSAAFRFFAVVQFGALIFIGAVTGFMIVSSGHDHVAQANKNTERVFPIFAPRGLIFSSDGEILAQNELYFDLLVNSAEIPPADALVREISNDISSSLNLNSLAIYENLRQAVQKRFAEYVLLKGMSKEELDKIEGIIAGKSFFEIREVYRRNYPDGQAFAHILGYTGEVPPGELSNRDYFPGERIGKAGIEAFYDEVLSGKSGILIKKTNSRGEIFGQDIEREARAGEDMRISVNAKLQKKIYEILNQHVRALKISSAAAVLLDPRSGEVLALVSLPGFNANLFEGGITDNKLADILSDEKKPLFNRAVAGEYPSGSTIKPLIAAAALEEKLISADFLVYSGGAISVPSAYNSAITYEFKDWKAHGWTDLRKAIADSVNVYFYTIGGGYNNQQGLGIKKISEYLLRFGWGDILGIDIIGEKGGLIPSPKWKKETKGENWYIGDTYLTSIGQGDILVTPLQIAAATAVFANGGTLFTPHFAAKQNNAPKITRRNFVSSENIDIIREGMRRAVTSGSSRFLSDLPYTVAGKTGTAQTARARNHAWFTGFAPYENPEVAITVLLEEGESSNYAVRAAKDILDAYFEIFYPQDSSS